MISPYTPRGTKIICINDVVGTCRAPGWLYFPNNTLDGLAAGEIYTVDRIEFDPGTRSGFAVVLVEIPREAAPPRVPGFDIARFRPAALPKVLTDLLTTAPADLESGRA